MINFRGLTIFSIALMAAAALATFGRPAAAGPVTNYSPVGQVPYTRLGIYQQVFDIVADNGKMLRFGNAGRDLFGTNDIIFRPQNLKVSNRVVAANDGIRITINGSSADLYIPGDLCLYNHANAKAVTCKHQLGNGVIGAPWQAGSLGGGPNVRYIEPAMAGSATPGLQLGSTASSLATQAVNIGSGDDSEVHATNLGSGLAADFAGAVKIGDDSHPQARLFAWGAVKIGGQEPWYGWNNDAGRQNEGAGSGLDADVANGNQATLESAASCEDSGAGPRVACLCFLMKFSTEYTNNTGFETRYASPVKRCVDLGNRY